MPSHALKSEKVIRWTPESFLKLFTVKYFLTYSTFYPTTPGLKKYSNFNFKAIGRNSVLICTQFLYFYITVCLKLDIGGKFESNIGQ